MKIYKMCLEEFLDYFDFSYEKIENDFVDKENEDEGMVYRLIDNQGANLGGIEEERFSTIESIVDRLDIYYNDYIYRDLEEEYGIYETCEEMLNKLCQLNEEEQEKQSGHSTLLYYLINPNELLETREMYVNNKYNEEVLKEI